MKTRIVLTLARPTERNAKSLDDYRKALRDAGTDIELVEVFPGEEAPKEFDGLVLAGGGDMDPRRFGQEPDGADADTIDPDRDAVELELAKRAVAAGKPVFGICRGSQVLNVALEGDLIQHRSGHRKANGPIVAHRIRPEAGTLLANICGTDEFSVNSRHHQVVGRISPELRASAEVDSLIEAVEAKDGRWILGVQWHPETAGDPTLDPVPAQRLFGAFVEAARRVPAR